MAFGTSRIFRSTDVGAPQFNNAAGSLNAVLKAVLCTGYGSTPSLGWTVEFESGNVLVVRMKGGTRTFIQFDDSLTGSYTYVAAYSTMSSAFTGTERMPAAGQSNCYIVKKSLGTNTGISPWIIIGDDAGFYLWHKPLKNIVATTVGDLQSLTYFGDYIPLDLRNKWNFCIIGNISDPGCGMYKHTPAAPHYVMRDHLYNKGAIPIGITAFSDGNNGQLSLNMSPTATYTELTDAAWYNGVVLNVGRVFLYANGIAGASGIQAVTIGMGLFPGLYTPAVSTNMSDNSKPMPDISNNVEFTQNGKTIICGSLRANVNTLYNYNLNMMLGFISLLVGEGFRNV